MNQTALITGASSGIGLEFAKVFASQGYNLVLVARNRERLDTLAFEIKNKFQVAVEILVKDLSDPAAAVAIYNDTRSLGQQIDVLVNNAGMGLGGKFTDHCWADELKLLQVNVMAVSNLCHIFGGEMVKRGAGGILNVSSIAAFLPGPLMANYYASKAYVLMLTAGLRNEFKSSGVTVTALCPGPTHTELFLRSGMSSAQAAKAHHSLTAAQVASAGYRALVRDKACVVPGWSNRLLVLATRLLPLSLLAKLARSVNRQHPH